jgi:hypothetical protein
MNNRDQIAKNMMFAVANLINNKDDSKIPQLTTEYWKAAVAFHDEFAHEPTVNQLVTDQITKFEDLLKN